MMTQHTYNPAQLSGYLLSVYKRTGGLTASEIAGLKGVSEKPLDLSPMQRAFDAAHSNGVRSPFMRIEGYTLKPAKFYPGRIYVTEDTSGFNEYMGKLENSQFYPAPNCKASQKQAILAACANPLDAVVKFGRKFGRCSVCSRPLTDPVSIQRAIGPICAQKFGF